MAGLIVSRTLCVAVISLPFIIAPIGVAQAADKDRIAELERRLDDSTKLIDELSRRVRELEARSAQPISSPAAASADDSAKRLDDVEQQVTQMVESRAHDHGAGLAIHGFADVGAGTHNPLFPNNKGAYVGSLDLYMTPEIGERTRALFELNFETNESGELDTDLERAQLGLDVGQTSTIWLGRFHTPYGYYNTAFHHGQQISVSLRRPRFLEFEDHGGILPAHTVGAWWAGARRLDESRWTYDLYVGNAQRIINGTLDMGAAGVQHGNVTVGGNIGFTPGKLDTLKVGASYLTSEVEDDALVQNRTRLNNLGVYALYDSNSWENMIELYVFDNEDLSGGTGTHRSNAGFMQFAYRLARSTPYLRYERADLDQTDPYFSAQTSGGSYDRAALGLRFDLNPAAALRFELARTNNTDRLEDEFSEVVMQYAARF
jgi:hypothetical protein